MQLDNIELMDHISVKLAGAYQELLKLCHNKMNFDYRRLQKLESMFKLTGTTLNISHDKAPVHQESAKNISQNILTNNSNLKNSKQPEKKNIGERHQMKPIENLDATRSERRTRKSNQLPDSKSRRVQTRSGHKTHRQHKIQTQRDKAKRIMASTKGESKVTESNTEEQKDLERQQIRNRKIQIHKLQSRLNEIKEQRDNEAVRVTATKLIRRDQRIGSKRKDRGRVGRLKYEEKDKVWRSDQSYEESGQDQ